MGDFALTANAGGFIVCVSQGDDNAQTDRITLRRRAGQGTAQAANPASSEEGARAMSLQDLTPQEASQRILTFLKEDRLVQSAWHKQDNGRELACMIGALDPSITDASQCPSAVMPQWLAHCTVSLFDGQKQTDALSWAERYAGLMARWHVLTPDAWARVETRFKIESVKFAIAAAEPVCKDKSYWPQVTAAAQQVLEALEGKGDLAAACAAAHAAAYAAYAAAYAAADAAAYAAAYAADAAEAAAEAAEAAAEAAEALASKLLDAIELEVLSAETVQ